MARRSDRQVAVIMAGGSGERFWPLSREDRPKQLLHLTSPDETMLQEAVNRITPLIKAEDVYISTTRSLARAIRKSHPGVPPKNVLAEPCKRNTSGCLCWVAAELIARYGDESAVTMAVLTADHQIGQPARFRREIGKALAGAAATDHLVTIGIRPTRPETGYGYIEAGERLRRPALNRVDRFREKPNRDLAEEFVDSGHHFWNSGMFFWRISTFLAELDKHSPSHSEVTRAMAKELARGKRKAAERLFDQLPNISIDFALMEKSDRVLMLEGTFPWDDVGAWDALDRTRRRDSSGNVVEGDVIVFESNECVLVNEARKGAVAVGVVGMRDLIVIVTDDAVLVARKDQAQEVRQIARELKARGARQA